MKNNKPLISAIPLFLAILIDGMGLGILFPVLNSLLMNPHTGMLAVHTSDNIRDFTYGAVISVFMLFWFFGSAILGDLSDYIGRKKGLVICLLGSALGYLLTAISILTHSLWLLFLGRIIDGFTAGSQPIAQAAVIDLAPKNQTAKYIGLVLFAASIGFIFGPLIGGLLSDKHLVSWFSYTTPFYFAAIISFLNAVMLVWFFKEKGISSGKYKLRLAYAVQLFSDAFRNKNIRLLSVGLLFLALGWGAFFSYLPMYLYKSYHYKELMISLFMTVLSIGFGFGNSTVVGFCEKRFKMSKTVLTSLLLTGLGILIMLIGKSTSSGWVAIAPIGCAMAVAYASLITLFSQQVDDASQGWVMGVTGSVSALAFAFVTFIGGFLASLSVSYTMGLAVICLVLGAGVMVLWTGNGKVH